jgi:hypothetical protein
MTRQRQNEAGNRLPVAYKARRRDSKLCEIDIMSRSPLDDALARLSLALAQLEAASAQRIAFDARRDTLDTELAVMQDDRARLAVELDGSVARLRAIEAAAQESDRRIERAMGEVRAALARAQAAGH